MNWIEWILVATARKRGHELATAIRGNADPATTEACQRFLEAHGPEYADVRAWNARLAMN